MEQDIDLATKLQKELQGHTLEWWPLDLCLNTVRNVWSVDTVTPELLDCLEEAVALVYSAYSDSNKGLADMDTERWRAAIAKAKGE